MLLVGGVSSCFVWSTSHVDLLDLQPQHSTRCQAKNEKGQLIQGYSAISIQAKDSAEQDQSRKAAWIVAQEITEGQKAEWCEA